MNTLFDENGNLDIDELILNSPSFQKIMEDNIVTPEEKQEQSERVVALLHKIEQICDDEQKKVIRELLAELSVLIAISQN